jgi:ribonuclease J
MKNGCYFLPLGGCEEIGMNLNGFCISHDQQEEWIIVDAGVSIERKLGITLVMASPEILLDKNVKAIVCTHGHEDHIGSIPFILKKFNRRIPIYATLFTAGLIRLKLTEHNLLEKTEIIIVEPDKPFTIGMFEINFIYITHSIPEPNLLLINFKPFNYKIVHTGDWKFDTDPVLGEPTDKNKLKLIGDQGVDALICDSTNAMEMNYTPTEGEAKKNLDELVRLNQNKRIFMSCFASNLARLVSIIEIAKKYNKKVILLGKSMGRMKKVAEETGHMKLYDHIITPEELGGVDPKTVIILCTGSQAETGSVLYKLAYSFPSKLSIKAGDLIVFSARKIPGNERPIVDLQNALIRRGAEILDSSNFKRIHVSGHPSQPEVKEMIELIRPDLFIPVHGQPINFVEMKKIALSCGIKNIMILSNGDHVDLCNKTVLFRHVATKDCLDGNQVIPMDSIMLKNRAILGTDGVVFVSLYNRSGVKVSSHGVLPHDICTQKDHLLNLKKMVSTVLNENINLERAMLIKRISAILVDYFYITYGKQPLTFIHFCD